LSVVFGDEPVNVQHSIEHVLYLLKTHGQYQGQTKHGLPLIPYSLHMLQRSSEHAVTLNCYLEEDFFSGGFIPALFDEWSLPRAKFSHDGVSYSSQLHGGTIWAPISSSSP